MGTFRRFAWLLVLAWAPSCSPREKTKTAPAEVGSGTEARSAEKGPSCEERVARLGSRLAKHTQGDALTLPEGIQPIESTKGKAATGRHLAVVLRRDGQAAMGGRPIRAGQLGFRLDAERALEMEFAKSQRRPEPSPTFYLWVDARTPMATLRAVLADIPEEFEVRLALAGPMPELTPADTAMREQPEVAAFTRGVEQKTNASDKAIYVAEVVEKAVGMCTPLVKTFASVAGVEASEKGAYMAREVPKSLRACDCNVAQPDLLEYTFYAVMGAFDRPKTWIPIPADSKSAKVAADLVR